MKIKCLLTFPVVALTALLFAPAPAPAQSILLSAGNFAILGGTFISSTGVVGTDIVSGNIGLWPTATTGITGFPPAVLTGGGAIIGTGGETQQAQLDLTKAFNGLLAMPSNTNLSNTDLGGLTLGPGVYTFNGAATQGGALVLDAHGQNDAYWVFQIATSLTTAVNSSVTIINPGSNGGSDDGVFWVAGAAITVGANNAILGNYLAGTSITFGGTTSGAGRALAMAGVTLSQNAVNSQGGPSGSDYTGGLMYNPAGAVVPTPPIFTVQPVNQTVVAGSNATFNVAASNSPTIQWQRQAFGTLTYVNLTNTGAYSNVTTTTMTVTNATLVMSGDQFRAVATNGGGNTTSTSALLTVTTPLPIFTTQPVNQTVVAGSNTTFMVAASGNATFQWQIEPFGNLTYANLTNTGAYSNVTGTTLGITNTTQAMSGDQFRVVATNAGGSTTSTSASLTVTTALPVFFVQPMSQTTTVGSNVSFTVLASGNATYQWQREPFGSLVYSNLTNTGAYSNVTGATLNVSNVTQAMSGDQFQAVATNLGGSTTSTSALLTVQGSVTPLPVFSAQPVNQAIVTGANTTFIVAASGGGTFQWQVLTVGSGNYVNLTDNTTYTGSNTTTLMVSNATLGLSGDQYRAVATNGGGNTTSTSALLTVTTSLPIFTLQPVNQTAVTGTNATFIVAAGGAAIQWQRQAFGTLTYSNLTNTGAYSNVTGTVLSITNATLAMSGDQFQAVATNLGGSTTSTSASLTVTTALPVFTTQPVNDSVIVGVNATFTALANGNATYQWQREPFGNLTYANLTNTGAYSNVTGTTLTVSNTTLAMNGDQFRAVATNLGGSTSSTSALLTVTVPAPVITTQPTNQTAVTGAGATFTVTASGNGTYQWQVLAIGSGNYVNIANGSIYSGVTSGTLTVSNSTLAMSGDKFRAVATNLGGNATSDAATLTVNSGLPIIVEQPVSVTIKIATNTMFTVVATGSGTLTYAWEKNGIKLKNGPRTKQATTATLLLIHNIIGNEGNYQVVVTNSNGSVSSAIATLTVTPTPVVAVKGRGPSN